MRVVNAAILAKMCLAGIEDVTTGRARRRSGTHRRGS